MALIVNKTERVTVTYKNGVMTIRGKNIKGTLRISPENFRSVYFSGEEYGTIDVEVSN